MVRLISVAVLGLALACSAQAGLVGASKVLPSEPGAKAPTVGGRPVHEIVADLVGGRPSPKTPSVEGVDEKKGAGTGNPRYRDARKELESEWRQQQGLKPTHGATLSINARKNYLRNLRPSYRQSFTYRAIQQQGDRTINERRRGNRAYEGPNAGRPIPKR